MPAWLPSIPYQVPGHGYWDPVTSTLEWCEEVGISPASPASIGLLNMIDQDYYATPYAAEIVNTLTNVLFLYFAYLGLRSCIKYGHDTVFHISFIGYLLVGIGSFCFHATLKCKTPGSPSNTPL